MRKKIMSLSILLILIVAGIFGWKHTHAPVKEVAVHYHAGFLVYVGGVKQDFSDFKYMNFTPCSEHSHKLSSAEEQIEKAHLHDGISDVVHVHRGGGTWGDLFKNISYTFPADQPLAGYINGEKRASILTEPIVANQSIIITVGSETDVDLTQYVTLDHIKEVESKSELCGVE